MMMFLVRRNNFVAELIISPAAGKYLKKIKDKNLKGLFKDAIDEIVAE